MTSTLESRFPVAETVNGPFVDDGYSYYGGMLAQVAESDVLISSLVPGFHLRQSGTDAIHVRLLVDAAGSVELPAILVQRAGMRIIDGLHRVEAAKVRRERSIRARVVDCTDEEALVLAIRTNVMHGLPLSKVDRISAAKRVLTTHPDWSDRAIAGIAGLSAKTVASLRNRATDGTLFNGKRLGRDGKRRPLTAAEGRRRAEEYIRAHPRASIREIAREADVSLGTVHDVRTRLRDFGHAEGGHAEGGQTGTGQTGTVETTPLRQGEEETAHAAAVTAFETTEQCAIPQSSKFQPGGVGKRDGDGQAIGWPAVAAKLASDPALRYTEGGRAFYRWMNTHSMQADEWQEFIDAIPEHWVQDVSRIASGMSEEWRQFACRLRSMKTACG